MSWACFANIRSWRGSTTRHVEKLASLATEVRFDRDQILFREGDDCSEFC